MSSTDLNTATILSMLAKAIEETSESIISDSEATSLTHKIHSDSPWMMHIAKSMLDEDRPNKGEMLCSGFARPQRLVPVLVSDIFGLNKPGEMHLERVSRPVKVFFKRRKIKYRLLSVQFHLITSSGETVPNVPFEITPHYTVHPYQLLGPSKTGTVYAGASYLKGRTNAVSQEDGLVDFSRGFFTNGTSELPNGKLHLLIRSPNPKITPFLIENVCVRSKRIKIREDISEKEKREEMLLSS